MSYQKEADALQNILSAAHQRTEVVQDHPVASLQAKKRTEPAQAQPRQDELLTGHGQLTKHVYNLDLEPDPTCKAVMIKCKLKTKTGQS